MKKKFKVTFEIEGEWLGDDVELDIGNLKGILMHLMDSKKGQDYYSNRSFDTMVDNLVIKKVK